MSHRTCSLPGCDRKHCARNLCKKHYYAAGHGFRQHQCRVPACEALTTAKTGDGLCEMHYARRRRTGTLDEGQYFKPWLTPAEVLWDRAEPNGDCILWTGSLDSLGYGRVDRAGWGTYSPHRFSWSLVNGPVPDGLELDHTCHNADLTCDTSACVHRRCINPDHLEPVTHIENVRRVAERRALVKSNG